MLFRFCRSALLPVVEAHSVVSYRLLLPRPPSLHCRFPFLLKAVLLVVIRVIPRKLETTIGPLCEPCDLVVPLSVLVLQLSQLFLEVCCRLLKVFLFILVETVLRVLAFFLIVTFFYDAYTFRWSAGFCGG